MAGGRHPPGMTQATSARRGPRRRRRARRTARAARAARPSPRRATGRRGRTGARGPRSPRPCRRRARPVTATPRPSRRAAWWWKELTATDSPGEAGQERAGLDRHVVQRLGRGRGLAMVVDVLVQRPAAGDVHRLQAAADAEQRHPARVGGARERELGGVDDAVGRAEPLVAAARAVGERVEVRPAGEAQAVEPLEQRVAPARGRPAPAPRAVPRRPRSRAGTASRAAAPSPARPRRSAAASRAAPGAAPR